VDYLIVRPMEGFNCDTSVSYARHWKHTWRGLEVGHRGAGCSFKEAPKRQIFPLFDYSLKVFYFNQCTCS
jgi:hypothetical protein